MLGCALAICVATGILVGVAPAITTARRNSVQGGRSIAGGLAARGIRRALVVTEFALAIILLFGAGLLIRSLWLIQNVDPGFNPHRMRCGNGLPRGRGAIRQSSLSALRIDASCTRSVGMRF